MEVFFLRVGLRLTFEVVWVGVYFLVDFFVVVCLRAICFFDREAGDFFLVDFLVPTFFVIFFVAFFAVFFVVFFAVFFVVFFATFLDAGMVFFFVTFLVALFFVIFFAAGATMKFLIIYLNIILLLVGMSKSLFKQFFMRILLSKTNERSLLYV